MCASSLDCAVHAGRTGDRKSIRPSVCICVFVSFCLVLSEKVPRYSLVIAVDTATFDSPAISNPRHHHYPYQAFIGDLDLWCTTKQVTGHRHTLICTFICIFGEIFKPAKDRRKIQYFSLFRLYLFLTLTASNDSSTDLFL